MSAILVTGGTGALGRVVLARAAKEGWAESIRCYSRDEHKQAELLDTERAWAGPGAGTVRYLIGDIRDRERLRRACYRVDAIVHIAALTYVGIGISNTDELVKTNVLGTMNVIDAAIAMGVPRVLCITSDKGCHPANSYGLTKGLGEKYAVDSNAFAFPQGTRVSCIRFGNLMWSRGSVAYRFRDQYKDAGRVQVTDHGMTRFGIRLSEAVERIQRALEEMRGGEVFVPRLPSFRIPTVAEAVAGPDVVVERTGVRAGGEKIHETILTEEECRHAVAVPGAWIVEPEIMSWTREKWRGDRPLWAVHSGANEHWLTAEDIRASLAELEG